MGKEALRVDGLIQFRKNLKKIDSDLPKKVRIALNKSADIVVDGAKPKIPKRSGKAARSVKAKSTSTVSRVSGGGNRAPYYPWLDFGGRVGRKDSIKRQFKVRGRYIYSSYFKAKASGKFQDRMEEALLDVAKQAGVEIE